MVVKAGGSSPLVMVATSSRSHGTRWCVVLTFGVSASWSGRILEVDGLVEENACVALKPVVQRNYLPGWWEGWPGCRDSHDNLLSGFRSICSIS